jgi:hypothetical protein
VGPWGLDGPAGPPDPAPRRAWLLPGRADGPEDKAHPAAVYHLRYGPAALDFRHTIVLVYIQCSSVLVAFSPLRLPRAPRRNSAEPVCRRQRGLEQVCDGDKDHAQRPVDGTRSLIILL